MDFIESGKLATDQIKFFVLDEAGELNASGAAAAERVVA